MRRDGGSKKEEMMNKDEKVVRMMVVMKSETRKEKITDYLHQDCSPLQPEDKDMTIKGLKFKFKKPPSQSTYLS